MRLSKSSPTFAGLLCGAAFVAAIALAGCAVEVKNLQAKQEVAKLTQPAGSVYTGWRVFQDKCAACHGPDASGRSGGPDLLLSAREMGPRRFVATVLNRYDLGLGAGEPARDSAARASWIEAVVQGKAGVLAMPAWEGEPSVSAHILDLYAYVSARADGTQGPGRPPR